MKTALGIWLTLAALASAAGLDFPEELKDFKASADATTITADFSFTNKSGKPVTIAKSDPGCTCLKIQISGGKLKYAPGESGVIRTTLDMTTFSGTIDKTIRLWLNDDPADKPSKELTIRVHIPVLVNLEPKSLSWDIGGKLEPKILRITMSGEKPIHVLRVSGTSEAFSYELKPVEKGKSYDLVVTPLSTESKDISVVRIETDCEIPKHRSQQAFSVIRQSATGQTAAQP